MFSTELSTIFPILTLVALVILVIALVVRQEILREDVVRAVEFVQKGNSRSVSLRRMAEVEATLTELLDSYNSLLTSHKKLRSRIGMREAREKKKNGENGLDLDPDAAKAATKAQLRAECKAKGLI